jgi:putative phage-type endonuclease
MAVRFIDCVQGSPEWFKARAGHATASRFAAIMGTKEARNRYMWELVAERLTGVTRRDSGGQAKEWGHDAERIARELYMERSGEIVRQVGFAQMLRPKWVGCSSDGLVMGQPIGIEIKSPFDSSVHAETLGLGMPDLHHWQTQGNLWVLELEELHFISFDPSFPVPHDLYIEQIRRREGDIKELQHQVKLFLAEVNTALQDIQCTTN